MICECDSKISMYLNKLINEKEILDAMAQRIADAPESLLSKAQQQQADVLHQINFLNKLRRNVE